jgi:sugar lactone lactonase YvrE
MAGRKQPSSKVRRNSIALLATFLGLFLALAALYSLRQAIAGKNPLPGKETRPTAIQSLDGMRFEQTDAGSAVIGEYDGMFDPASGQMRILERKTASKIRNSRIASRFEPGSEVAPGSFGFSVLASTFIASGDNPGTVSGEVQIANNSTSTFYNTRLVFTAFKVGGPGGADAGNIPGASGFAYFNDGQIAYNGKLNVSRYYGDIAPSGNAKAIWTFATVAQPPGFFFSFRVLADIGVAAESVQPSAVQVSSVGTSVQISGRGFNNPTVEILNSSAVIGPMSVTGSTSTSITATVPANLPAGQYNLRITNQGATPGGAGSSLLRGKLSVTGIPDGAHTISGSISSLPDAGPYLVSSSATISSSLSVKPGTVIYVANGAAITVAGGGNIIANGGVPGIPNSGRDGAAPVGPARIVFTADRAPGAALPSAGAWGGINATAASSAEMVLRNAAVEYAGTAGSAAINLTGSGRKLRLADSIIRRGAGSAITALSPNDSLIGFTRNRIESNGSSAADGAIILSGNASLGLFELPPSEIPSSTSVGDGGYYFSSANDFSGNQADAVQIGTDGDNASNDFTKSGVLVGQGLTPIRIRGTSSNPAVVGATSPPAELMISPTANIQLAPGTDFMAGDGATKFGSIAANGYAGVYLGSPAPSMPSGGSGISGALAPTAVSDKFIEFNGIPGSGNWGAIFFTKNASASSILNWVKVQNGGNSSQGAGAIIVDTITIKLTNSQINNSASGQLLVLNNANVNTTGSNFMAGGGGGANLAITTIAGGVYGDGNQGVQISLGTPVAAAADPQGRGLYFVDATNLGNLIRFFNTSTTQVTLGGGIKVNPGAIRSIAGGGLEIVDNVPGRTADTGSVSGLAVSPTGDLVYFIDSGVSLIRVVNVSTSSKTVNGQTIAAGNVGTLASTGFGSSLNGLAVAASTGDVYVADATAGVNKIFKITGTGGNPTVIAGNGATTRADDVFSAGAATNVALLQPRAVIVDAAGAVYIADTGHARIIKVDGGQATLMRQFPPRQDSSAMPYQNNPFPSGLAIYNGKVYIANGNSQDIARIDSPGVSVSISGTIGTSCDYSSSNCGDGGAASAAAYGLLGSTGTPPLAGIAADGKGLFILDQASIQRGRIRYLNLSGAAVTMAGVTVSSNSINTIAGTGLPPPYDGGLATSAGFNTPTGVAVDPQGNLWVSDMLSSKIRYVNRGTSPITLFAGTASEQTVAPGTIITVNRDVGVGATDNVPVIQAGFDTPQGLVATSQGVFVADSKKGPAVDQRRTGLVRFFNTSSQTVSFFSGQIKIDVDPGMIKTIIGGGVTSGSVGDGQAPLSAKFLAPEDIAVHPTTGDIYVADAGNKRVRKIVRSTGVVSSLSLPTGTNDQYTGIGFDSAGRLLVVNSGAGSILREKTAGSGANANGFDTIFSGDPLKRPRDIAEGADGSLYVTNAGDTSPISAGDYRIIRINPSVSPATATVFAGSTTPGYAGDGGAPGSALLNLQPDPINITTVGNAVSIRTTVNIVIGIGGEIIFTDSKNNAVRRIK